VSGGWLFRFAVVPLALASVLIAGTAIGAASGFNFESGPFGWQSDGAGRDTFWDSSMVDVPGLSLYQVHCHGMMRLDFQIGATGPEHSNPCYAAMRPNSGSRVGGQKETLMTLPGGTTAIYRQSVNDGPWSYSIGDINDWPPPGG
jgi:hypothetical protein